MSLPTLENSIFDVRQFHVVGRLLAGELHQPQHPDAKCLQRSGRTGAPWRRRGSGVGVSVDPASSGAPAATGGATGVFLGAACRWAVRPARATPSRQSDRPGRLRDGPLEIVHRVRCFCEYRLRWWMIRSTICCSDSPASTPKSASARSYPLWLWSFRSCRWRSQVFLNRMSAPIQPSSSSWGMRAAEVDRQRLVREPLSPLARRLLLRLRVGDRRVVQELREIGEVVARVQKRVDNDVLRIGRVLQVAGAGNPQDARQIGQPVERPSRAGPRSAAAACAHRPPGRPRPSGPRRRRRCRAP